MNRSAMLRRRRERLDIRYETVGELGDPCSYCGVVSVSWDHIPPLFVVETMNDVDIDMDNLRKVPACVECNSFLGANRIDNLRERRKYVLERLERKYAHYLRMPQWDEEEFEDMSISLADDIRRSAKFAWYIKQRTAWARTGGRVSVMEKLAVRAREAVE